MKKNKQNYVAPGLTVVEFRVEKGYAYSFGPVEEVNKLVEQEFMMHADGNNLVGGQLGDADLGQFHDIEQNGGSGWTFENGGYF